MVLDLNILAPRGRETLIRPEPADEVASPRPVVAPPHAPRRSKFKVEDFDTLRPLAQSWRVKGLWPATGLCFVAGPSMSGKSFWVLDALAKVCFGGPVLGRKAVPGGVLYVASEGSNGVRGRVEGLRTKVGSFGGRAAFIGQAPNLTDEDDLADLRETVAEQQAEMEAAGYSLGVVVIDTLSASIPGADENTGKDMGPVLAGLQGLAQSLGLLVLVIAHTGKNPEAGIRGWSGLLANADGVIMLDEPDNSGLRGGKVFKVKDGESGARFGFRLAVVDIGEDEDGDPMTTCVVEEAAGPSEPRTGRPATKAGADGQLLLRAFNRLGAEAFLPVAAPGLKPDAKAVRIDVVRREAFALGLGPSEPVRQQGDDEETWRKARKGWTDARSKAFDRARKHLIAEKMLRQEGDLLWCIDQFAQTRTADE